MNLDIMPNERSHTQKDKSCMIYSDEIPRVAKFRDRKWNGVSGKGQRRQSRGYLMGIEFHFGKMKKFCKYGILNSPALDTLKPLEVVNFTLCVFYYNKRPAGHLTFS